MKLPQLPPHHKAINPRVRGNNLIFDIVEVLDEERHVRLGDVFEWIAGALLAGGAYLATSMAWLPVVVGGVFLAYQAQCYAGHKVQLPKLRLRLRKRARRQA